MLSLPLWLTTLWSWVSWPFSALFGLFSSFLTGPLALLTKAATFLQNLTRPLLSFLAPLGSILKTAYEWVKWGTSFVTNPLWSLWTWVGDKLKPKPAPQQFVGTVAVSGIIGIIGPLGLAAVVGIGSGYIFYKTGYAVGHFQGKTAGLAEAYKLVQEKTDALNSVIEAANAQSEVAATQRENLMNAAATAATAPIQLSTDVRAMCKAKCSMPANIRQNLKAIN